MVASLAHDHWRGEWRRQKGEKPRIMKTTDAAWIAARGGATGLDIAATPYDGLPADWQRENKLAAAVAVDQILLSIMSDTPLQDYFGFVERAAAVVHAKWVERNDSWCNEELKKPYDELPEGEKEKDRLFVRQVIEVLRQNI